jgi:hypothetical protein
MNPETRRRPAYTYSFGVGEFIAQMRHAEAMRREAHEHMLAEGYKWDGHDGYYKDESK